MATEYRKIQLIGGSSYAVTLPKDWVSEVKLRPGDFVTIQKQSDLSLLLVPQKTGKPVEQAYGEAIVEVNDVTDMERIYRMIVGFYLVGYRTIRVKFTRRCSEARNKLVEFIRKKLLGVEVVEERVDEIALQTFIEFREFPSIKLVTRMMTITQSMLTDAIQALFDLDAELSRDIIERDDSVDRLYLLSVRQLKRAVEDRNILRELEIKDFRHVLGYRLIAKSIERAADHAARIAEVSAKLHERLIDNLRLVIVELAKYANMMLENSWRALVKMDMDLANDVISNRKKILSMVEEASYIVLENYKDTKTVMNLGLVLESLKRITEYACDIAEIVINLAIGNRDRLRIGKPVEER
ncbi:MAG: PhoU domain-containing protein [Candidatus Bathyarchaeia archaeon]